MSRLIKFLLFAFLQVAVVFSCTYPDYFIAEPNWIREEPFVLTCFSKTPITDQLKIETLKNAIVKKYPNLFITAKSLPVDESAEEKKNIGKAPIITLQTGNGGHGLLGTLARFEGRFPSVEEFKSVVESPVKNELIKELTKVGFVALVIENWDQAKNERLLKCAQRGAKMAKDMTNQKCSIVRLNIADGNEKGLIDNIFVNGREKKSGILLVFGKGKGLHFFDDDESPNVIMELAQQLSKTTSAEAQNLGQRLLLDMPMPKMKNKNR